MEDFAKQKEELLEKIKIVEINTKILEKANKKVNIINILSLIFLCVGLLIWITEYEINLLDNGFLIDSIFFYVISVVLSSYSIATSKLARKRLLKFT
ncbi:hypothetical protein [Aliarcobacter butzleri]|uniref:hypothetical protein n=1 Tax=Aliarcobacter butzleri TaxID=28197 RepID=UPI001269E54F|nr:hypothetical protein [Aliarcobacter butzleri]